MLPAACTSRQAVYRLTYLRAHALFVCWDAHDSTPMLSSSILTQPPKVSVPYYGGYSCRWNQEQAVG